MNSLLMLGDGALYQFDWFATRLVSQIYTAINSNWIFARNLDDFS